jgi:hypothetical protein
MDLFLAARRPNQRLVRGIHYPPQLIKTECALRVSDRTSCDIAPTNKLRIELLAVDTVCERNQKIPYGLKASGNSNEDKTLTGCNFWTVGHVPSGGEV